MDVFFWILIGIAVLVFILLLTILGLVIYAGLLYNIEVQVGDPPVQEFVGYYKSGTGPYKNSSTVFVEVCCLAPSLPAFGVYYDDPKIVNETQLRWIVGSVVPKEAMKDPNFEEIRQLLLSNGFKTHEFPAVSTVVKADFPLKTDLSVIIGAYRVYPKLNYFVQENRLDAYPYIEYCHAGKIHYYAPLEKNLEFYVPEVDPNLNNYNSKEHSE